MKAPLDLPRIAVEKKCSICGTTDLLVYIYRSGRVVCDSCLFKKKGAV